MVQHVHQEHIQASQIGLPQYGCTVGVHFSTVYVTSTPWSCAVHNLCSHVLWPHSQNLNRFQNEGALCRN